MALEQTNTTPRKNFRFVNEDDPGRYPDVFGQYPVASWQAQGEEKYSFPVMVVDEKGGNRIIIRPRPYRDGDKLDDVGRKSVAWQIVAKFNNAIREPGLEENPANQLLYPDILNNLINSFAIHETGDLVVPTRGLVRARILDYVRKEHFGERDEAELIIDFMEDNEDNVDAQALSAPTVSGNAFQLAETAEFSADSDGIQNTSLLDLLILTRQLEGLANAPDALLRDVEVQANQIIGAADRTFQAFSRNIIPGRNFFNDPDRSTTKRKVHESKDLAGKVKYEARRSRPRLNSVVFENEQSLPSIAAMLGVDLGELIAANQQLDNPFLIPVNTIVRIPLNGQATRQG